MSLLETKYKEICHMESILHYYYYYYYYWSYFIIIVIVIVIILFITNLLCKCMTISYLWVGVSVFLTYFSHLRARIFFDTCACMQDNFFPL